MPRGYRDNDEPIIAGRNKNVAATMKRADRERDERYMVSRTRGELSMVDAADWLNAIMLATPEARTDALGVLHRSRNEAWRRVHAPSDCD